jgi:hypothetical protein
MTKDEALKIAGYNLDGVISDVEKFDGFDDVCLQTIKRVRSTIAEALEQPAQEPVAFTNADEIQELKDGMSTCYMYKEPIDANCIALYTKEKNT